MHASLNKHTEDICIHINKKKKLILPSYLFEGCIQRLRRGSAAACTPGPRFAGMLT